MNFGKKDLEFTVELDQAGEVLKHLVDWIPHLSEENQEFHFLYDHGKDKWIIEIYTHRSLK